MRAWRITFRFLLFVGALAAHLRAHDPGLSTVQVTVEPTEIKVVATFAPADAALLPAHQAGTPPHGESTPRNPSPPFSLYEMRQGEQRLALTEISVAGDDQVNVEYRFSYARNAAASGLLTLVSHVFAHLPPGHRSYLTVSNADGKVMAEALLSAREPAHSWTLAVPESNGTPSSANTGSALPPRPSEQSADRGVTPRAPSFAAFFQLGMEHILTGYDHLLFLLGLLVACTQRRTLVAMITSFTVGHSVTLLLATQGAVTLSSEIAEPLIAASLVYVGGENLLRRGAEPRGRWTLTFLFGLIHGFGFASVLRDLGIGQEGASLWTPLLAFNLGVEAGQLAVVGASLLLLALFRSASTLPHWAAPGLSIIIIGCGTYWLGERIFG